MKGTEGKTNLAWLVLYLKMKGKLKAVKIVGHEKSTYDRSADDLVIAVIKLAYKDCVKRHDHSAYKFFKDNYEVIPKQISDSAIKIYEEQEGIKNAKKKANRN